ncbi:MAG: D-alanine--D-alanine ligase [Bdellovibrionales bacterium]|nr:D-alanine--D-alanine ligase [Bdellovibrionales bacterium]
MNSINTKKIALIQGGFGIERDISLITGQNTAQALKRLKLSFEVFSADTNLIEKLKSYKPGLAFLAVHGPYGEDGTLQGILEYLKIPYTGSGVLLSSLCMDKILFKKWLSLQKITTPSFIHLQKNSSHEHLNLDYSHLGKNIKLSEPYKHVPFYILEKEIMEHPCFLPCVVKPSRSGSSIGVYICRSPKDWTNALKEVFKIDNNILIEQYIEGIEVAVPILNEKILTPVEIQPAKGHFYDFKRKYEKNQTQYFVPPRLNTNMIEKLKEITKEIQKLFQITSYGRADFLIDKKENIYLLEFNTLPGLTPLSLLPKSAQHDGFSYDEVILKILESASLDYL